MGEAQPHDDPEVELTPDDLAAYTNGRLPANAPETQQILTRALPRARRFCGWRVTPAESETLYLDGPGTRDLSLPTMHMTALTACTEDGIDLDVTQLRWSRQGLVRKNFGGCYTGRWSNQLGAIQITITHGYSVDAAADWRGAVLRICDLASQNVGPQLQVYRVDDVIRQWYKVGSPVLDDLIEYQLMGVA